MKRYGKLWEQLCSIENIALAHEKARRGKRNYSEVKMVDADPDKYFANIRLMLLEKTYQCSDYTIMYRREGAKDREIWKLPYFPDRIIHHCLVNVVGGIWDKTLIRDTYAAVKGRGIHDGVRRVKRSLDSDAEGTRYCLKMDVRKFYQSVKPEVQKQAMRRKIKDPDLLWLTDIIAESSPGLPIGNYPSQPIGNLVLSPLDHWIKEDCRIKHYFRYCDDMVILSSSKKKLHRLRVQIQEYLLNKFGLDLKQNWQVFPVDIRGIDFLGYRFFHDYTLVRKSIVSNFKRKFKHGNLRSLTAYNGWFKWADTHNLKRKYDWRIYERLQHTTTSTIHSTQWWLAVPLQHKSYRTRDRRCPS